MSKKEKETAVAVKDEGDAALAAFLEDDGLVTISQDVLKIPRIKLTQKMSNSCGTLAKEGEFASEVLGVNYGGSITIIPIAINESASFMEEGKPSATCYSKNLLTNMDGVLCADCPHGCYYADWDKGSPACKRSIDIVCIVQVDGVTDFNPIEMNFRKNNRAAGKAIANMIYQDKMQKRVQFSSAYTMTSKMDNKNGHDFAVVNAVVNKEDVSREDMLKIIPIARNFSEMKKRGAVETEGDNEVTDTDPLAAPTEECPL